MGGFRQSRSPARLLAREFFLVARTAAFASTAAAQGGENLRPYPERARPFVFDRSRRRYPEAGHAFHARGRIYRAALVLIATAGAYQSSSTAWRMLLRMNRKLRGVVMRPNSATCASTFNSLGLTLCRASRF